MEGFIKSFKPIWDKYNHEIILLSISLILIIISLEIYLFNKQTNISQAVTSLRPSTAQGQTENRQLTTDNQQLPTAKIRVEISGEVNKPDVYELKEGARLNDLVKIAGGLTDLAEKYYFRRNFNLAKVLNDQEKIYVPSTDDITNGIFIENKKILEYLNPQPILAKSDQNNSNTESDKILINSSETDELQLLPGVGEATAAKIINNRPYGDIQELLSKKVVSKKTFEAIRDLIQLN